jgi:glycosyltransferase involved in cell wall biosynthesis
MYVLYVATGWLGNELPQAIAGLDVVVNPSLRAWSETFCISNVEVMAMKIPLITFAVGGK